MRNTVFTLIGVKVSSMVSSSSSSASSGSSSSSGSFDEPYVEIVDRDSPDNLGAVGVASLEIQLTLDIEPVGVGHEDARDNRLEVDPEVTALELPPLGSKVC
ncbi:hypothetical protein Salat_1422100 [Sesamum alatum]|uniref:Uncharacterized protein n=1 Tax=Sesamum alatum TaxID=300844 RepID=A0AAE1YA57_9LAMI|nr:hypothetical protein Salat_1422100 [Sesamum alatum]